MEKEFNLSDTELVFMGNAKVIPKESVKEFIKRLKEELNYENSTNPDVNAIISRGQVLKMIDKLAGDKLNGN